jgi:type IV pilus assembly protein PilM
LNWAVEPIKGTDTISAIKNLLQKIGSQSKDICTAVAGQGTLIRFIKMPRMSLEQLKESLTLEADKYFPFPINEIYMDCQIIEDKRIKDNKMSVLVAVAKKNIIDERLALITELSLQTDVVGLDAVAVSNAAMEFQAKNGYQPDGKESGVFAVLDMGELKTTVVIFRDGAPRFTREISVGGKDCTQKIMEVLGCSSQEADDMRCQPGSRQEESFSACQSILQNLVSEIRLSFDYFSSEDSLQAKSSADEISSEDSFQVSKIFLTGDNANCSKTKEFFTKELGISVESWVPSAELEFESDASKEEFLRNINQLSVALGLAVTKNDSY